MCMKKKLLLKFVFLLVFTLLVYSVCLLFLMIVFPSVFDTIIKSYDGLTLIQILDNLLPYQNISVPIIVAPILFFMSYLGDVMIASVVTQKFGNEDETKEKKIFKIVSIFMGILSAMQFLISMVLVIIHIFFCWFIYFTFFDNSIQTESKKEQQGFEKSLKKYKDVKRIVLLSFGFRRKKLKNELYTKFLQIQDSYTKFDYDKLRSLCSDDFYNSYKEQMELLQSKLKEHIMCNHVLLDIKITSIERINNQIVVDVYMKVAFIDYIFSNKLNKIVKGNKKYRITNYYEMTFIKGVDISEDIVCPGCGANIKVNASGKCDFCDSIIVKKPNSFVLCTKRNIR